MTPEHAVFGGMMPMTLSLIRGSAPIYVTTLLVGAVIGIVAIPLLIDWQQRRRIGQQIYESGPQTHLQKQGTPTLGGIAFLAAAIAGLAIELWHWRSLLTPGSALGWWLEPRFHGAIEVGALTLSVGVIGFADDALKTVTRRPLGLRARWKFALIGLVAVAFVFANFSPGIHASGVVYQWFGAQVVLPIWAAALLTFLAILGSTNAVNLTDGLDGLAAGSMVAPLLVLSLFFLPPGFLVAGSVLGALLVFLWFNRHPARIFMGDTGSLALGALIAGLASQSGLLLLLPLLGIVFVIEAASVMIQVISFKTTGKRIFKMSPLHHHFELLGWPERKITATFIGFSTIAAGLTWYAAVATAPIGLK